MRKQLVSILSLTLFIFCSTSFAQTPSAAPAGPTNITAILEKAGQFTTLIRLMKSTQEADQINTQLNNSNQGLTIFAPPDNAFANLKSGTLNSLTDQQKVQLIQFHILPTFLSTTQFQTVSNPLRTQAGDSSNGDFPLNVTTSGNQVNISTGVNTATVANSIYSDGQLAVYQLDNVLLPLSLFGSSASPAPAPEAAAPEKAISSKAPTRSSVDTGTVDGSDAPASGVSFNVVLVAAICLTVVSSGY